MLAGQRKCKVGRDIDNRCQHAAMVALVLRITSVLRLEWHTESNGAFRLVPLDQIHFHEIVNWGSRPSAPKALNIDVLAHDEMGTPSLVVDGCGPHSTTGVWT